MARILSQRLQNETAQFFFTSQKNERLQQKTDTNAYRPSDKYAWAEHQPNDNCMN